MPDASRYYAIHEPAEHLLRIVADPAAPGRDTHAAVVDIYRTPDHGTIDTLLKSERLAPGLGVDGHR